MDKMVATITVVPRPGATEQDLSEYLRTSLGAAPRGGPVALVSEVAVSTLPTPPPDDAVPARV